MTNLQLVGEAVVDIDERPTFDAFWVCYPKKVAKFDAQKAWNRLSESERLAAIIGVVSWRQVWIKRGDLQFVPHPGTWLNGHRWEDELPDQWASTTHASHAPAAIPQTERGTMPDNVKALIAKLRGK